MLCRKRRRSVAAGVLALYVLRQHAASAFCGGLAAASARPLPRHLRGNLHRHAGETSTGVAASVEALEKPIRLPVWPAWFGIFYIILDLITGNPKAGAFLEDKFGGRVCPMIMDNGANDPFLLMAHHRHSFNLLDPFRYIFRSVLMPEGFPAHPHRGFETVTYCLRGGLVHRDSYGVKKSYGAPSNSDGSGDDGAVQWMTAGRGLLHEEMWRVNGEAASDDQELFQIWVNLPAAQKMVPPHMQILGEDAGVPSNGNVAGEGVEVQAHGQLPVASEKAGVKVRVIAGEAAGVKSPIETYSPMAILHVTMAPESEWSWPRALGWTTMLYMRRGEAEVGRPGTLVPIHHTATLSQRADEVFVKTGAEEADFVILAGEPLREPVEMASNIVMNTPGRSFRLLAVLL
eukprot:TRINITY_DN23634_c0_g1_i1.p1 TRINITY_DN23634_c0_g1~~TRINITY_DN23634_c0_g1_i1.p1  ORF type:complete len:402 (+),score=49.03 TRINITY_DN23634_c0_g1_i1:90-1295(+)